MHGVDSRTKNASPSRPLLTAHTSATRKHTAKPSAAEPQSSSNLMLSTEPAAFVPAVTPSTTA